MESRNVVSTVSFNYFTSAKSKKGFTLVEVIITLAIMSILGALAVSFFSFSLRTYSKSLVRSELQFDARMTSQLIASELRNVNRLSLNSASLSNPNEIVLSDIQSRYPRVSDVSFKIVEESRRYIVEYTITTFDVASGNEYILKSKVLINNRLSIDSANINTSSSAIYFTKPVSP